MDPGSTIALQDMQQTNDLLEQKQKGQVPPGEKPLTSAEKARKESMEMIESLLPVPELKPVTNQISLLKMNNQPPKVLYETVGKLAGINVLFDPQMPAGQERQSGSEQRDAAGSVGLYRAADQDVLEAGEQQRHFRHRRQRHQAPGL